MNYPRIYQRVYCQNLVIEPERFHSIHSVLFPRLKSGADSSFETLAADLAEGSPVTNPYDGKRKQMARPTGNDSRFYSFAKPGVAVIPIYGVLAKNLSNYEESCGGGTDIAPIAHAISQAVADPGVKAIILDIDSPGGEVTGIPELGDRIRSATQRKPIYSFTDAKSASGAIWLGSQASESYATRSSRLGSIGVYAAWLDQTVAMQLRGLKLELFTAGKHKGAGAPFRGLTKEERKMIQKSVDQDYVDFKAVITRARPSVTEDTMQGQMFSAPEAHKRGLIDGIVADWEELVALV